MCQNVPGDNLELTGTRADKDLYQLNFKAVSPERSHSIAESSTLPGTTLIAFPAMSLDIWHRRFGHAHHAVIKKMEAENSVDPEPCKGCALGKSHRQPFPNSGRRRATKIGEIVHSDLCGPMSVPSITRSLYYVLFQDDASGFQVVYFLKTKCEAFHYFKIYAARMLTETNNCISILRSDNGGSMLMGILNITFPQMAFDTKFVLHTHPSKTVLVSDPTEILWNPP